MIKVNAVFIIVILMENCVIVLFLARASSAVYRCTDEIDKETLSWKHLHFKLFFFWEGGVLQNNIIFVIFYAALKHFLPFFAYLPLKSC